VRREESWLNWRSWVVERGGRCWLGREGKNAFWLFVSGAKLGQRIHYRVSAGNRWPETLPLGANLCRHVILAPSAHRVSFLANHELRNRQRPLSDHLISLSLPSTCLLLPPSLPAQPQPPSPSRAPSSTATDGSRPCSSISSRERASFRVTRMPSLRPSTSLERLST
jgi:hypothetical protein